MVDFYSDSMIFQFNLQSFINIEQSKLEYQKNEKSTKERASLTGTRML